MSVYRTIGPLVFFCDLNSVIFLSELCTFSVMNSVLIKVCIVHAKAVLICQYRKYNSANRSLYGRYLINTLLGMVYL